MGNFYFSVKPLEFCKLQNHPSSSSLLLSPKKKGTAVAVVLGRRRFPPASCPAPPHASCTSIPLLSTAFAGPFHACHAAPTTSRRATPPVRCWEACPTTGNCPWPQRSLPHVSPSLIPLLRPIKSPGRAPFLNNHRRPATVEPPPRASIAPDKL
jgi:hypothetical protein